MEERIKDTLRFRFSTGSYTHSSKYTVLQLWLYAPRNPVPRLRTQIEKHVSFYFHLNSAQGYLLDAYHEHIKCNHVLCLNAFSENNV